MKYYVLMDDIHFPGRWYLGDIRHLNNWLFRDPPAEYMEPCNYEIDVYQDGLPMDFTISEAFGVPILSEKAKDALIGLKEVDEPFKFVVLEPVEVANKDVKEKFFVMIIETQLDCVDEDRSEFEKVAHDDPVRPDLAGEYGVFFSLVVDPSKTNEHHIFRIKKQRRAIIVSEEVKRRFEEAGVTGAVFESVNGDCRTLA